MREKMKEVDEKMVFDVISEVDSKMKINFHGKSWTFQTECQSRINPMMTTDTGCKKEAESHAVRYKEKRSKEQATRGNHTWTRTREPVL